MIPIGFEQVVPAVVASGAPVTLLIGPEGIGNAIRLGIRPRESGHYMVALSVPEENDRVIIHNDLELDTRNIRVGGGRVLRINHGTMTVNGTDWGGIYINNDSTYGAAMFLSNGGGFYIQQISGGYKRIN